jgi:hypothetical protein
MQISRLKMSLKSMILFSVLSIQLFIPVCSKSWQEGCKKATFPISIGGYTFWTDVFQIDYHSITEQLVVEGRTKDPDLLGF